MQPPQIALQPGSTNTAAVKQLQDWLVANGYMTQAQVNTGYGTYGPQTTQAVLQVQQKLGVDNSTGPGYWGPRTLAAVSTAGTAVKSPTANPTPAPTAPAVQPAAEAVPTPSPQKALLTAISEVAQTAAITGKPPLSFADALDLAAKDPNIVAKYADMAKMDTQSFTQQLEQAKSTYSTEAGLRKTQFENERKALAEHQAAAGTAYSGFRGKAQNDLAQTESGIVSSSNSQLKNNINNLTSAFEAKYGTGATPSASITVANPLEGNVSLSGLQTPGGNGTTTLTGNLAGGITGTVAPAKAADINASALNSYNTAAFPKV